MGGTEPVGGAAAKRVLGGVLLCGAAFIVFALFGGGTAYGLTVTSQDAETNNVGVGVANSGGNAAVGNVTNGDQTAVNAQGSAALGGIANNSGSASNSSSGDATIVTGAATGIGNQSTTNTDQSANSVGGGGGLNVTAQDADTNNVGVGVGNSGLNGAVGNVQNGDQTAVNAQGALALGGIANNTGGASNTSRGSATIITGPATGIGNQSATGVNQSANSVGLGPGFDIIVQDVDTNNVGVGIGNSGLNGALGNVNGDQTAVNLQGALAIGGIANNFGSASNVSSGNALIVTGPATGIGNQSVTGVSQSAIALGGGGFLPAVILQGANTNNFGVGLANTGLNPAVGNLTGSQLAVNLQGALALGGIANSFGGASNVSNGNTTVVTGGGNAVGNQSSTTSSQFSLAGATPVDAGILSLWPALGLLGLLVRRRR
jgi:hypothetical protein